MVGAAENADFEPQDLAEVFDETNLTEARDQIANFDEIEDVFDLTARDGDADEDEFDETDIDDDDLEEGDELDYRAAPAADDDVEAPLPGLLEPRPQDNADLVPPRLGAVDPADIVPDTPEGRTEAAIKAAIGENPLTANPVLITPAKP